MAQLKVSRDVNTKQIYDVYDLFHGKTYRGKWDKIRLPEKGWTKISESEFIVITIA